MKKLAIILIPLSTFGQVKDAELMSNTLRVKFGNIWETRGSVDFTGILKPDVNNNLVISSSPSEIKGLHTGANNTVIAHRSTGVWNSDNNFIVGENDSVKNSNSNTIFATDAIIINTTYSTVNGDGSWIDCESCDEDGNFNKIVGYYHTVRGSNNKIGTWGAGKKYLYSSATGNNLDIQASYVHASGLSTTFNNSGWGYGYNGVRFFVYADGRVNINGVIYRFPTSQGPAGSVLTNDGNGNLSWTVQTVQPTLFRAVDMQGRSFIIQGYYK